MKIMFTVQGDGRGHMTQAIAAAQTFERHGHEIVAVTVGTNPSRTMPDFFAREFDGRLLPIGSPGFSFQKARGVATLATLRQAVAGRANYGRSLGAIRATVERMKPDLIVNFLEPLMGVYNLLHRHPIPVVSVGHQFMLGHPEFVRCAKFAFQQWTMRQYLRLTGARSVRLALSFYPAADIPERRLFVCPPLLREEVFKLPHSQPGRFLLAYVLNQGYAKDIVRWHAAFPEVELHCFCERPKVEPVWRYDATLFFHKLDGTKFLRMMAESRGVACTAGFESLNEAAWFGKPLLVVPVENHIEQYLNALDAQKAGLALPAASFDLTPLLRPWKTAKLESYRAWLRHAAASLLSIADEVAYKPVRTYIPASAPMDALATPAAPQLIPSLPRSRYAGKSRGRPELAVSSPEVVGHY
jgi:uncharacterized protein (TIGR00661 family)